MMSFGTTDVSEWRGWGCCIKSPPTPGRLNCVQVSAVNQDAPPSFPHQFLIGTQVVIK